jgi:stage II sporulation protein D
VESGQKYTTAKNVIPVLKDDGWGLYIQSDTAVEGAVLTDSGANAVTFTNGGKIMFIADGNSPARAMCGSGIITIGSTGYRDSIEFDVNGSNIMGVNVIDMNKYLYGVVPSEMSASWNEEALKAQAVAARTYAYSNKTKHGNYDLCDSVCCQDYNGTTKEQQSTTDAVNATGDEKIYYNNNLISAYYFSSSGGKTASSENTWSEVISYLRGVDEVAEKEYKQWTRTYTYQQFSEICKSKGLDVGTVTAVNAEYDNDGLVSALSFTGSGGTKSVYKDGIRSFFSASSDGSLPSRNFSLATGSAIPADVSVLGADGTTSTISFNSVSAMDATTSITTLDKTATVQSSTETTTIQPLAAAIPVGTVVINGKGYGHLVGMSQYGAKGMAEDGFTYQEILQHYYTGVTIK